ncbi:MAG: polysaccharide deacetylase family protein [bacterium]|nr:polysaccharide deacetylase family protein [bacterium]
MKKIITGLALTTAALGLCTMSALAAGETIRYCDNSAYINNYPIPCYDINEYCGIYVKDLTAYGFSVDYNHESSTVNITRDASCTSIKGIEGVQRPWQLSGTPYAQAGASEIRVLLNGQETPSYWVDGYMMILIDNMDVFGSKEWNNDLKSFFLRIPGLPETQYAPIGKAKRQYTRYKAPSWEIDTDSYYGLSETRCDWGFVRVEGDAPEIEGWQGNLLSNYDSYYIDPARPHKIYLTFDEGYEAGYTPQILDVLSKYSVPATFFCTGEYLREAPELVRDMIDRGFIVGNHTQNHANLALCTPQDIVAEIDGVSNTLRDEFGYTTYYMRPPEGTFNERSLAVAKDMGYNTILWSFAYYDYDPSAQHGVDYAYDMITRYMHDGAIYLLHAVSSDNANVLESIIQYAIENGYEFGSLDDLCNP